MICEQQVALERAHELLAELLLALVVRASASSVSMRRSSSSRSIAVGSRSLEVDRRRVKISLDAAQQPVEVPVLDEVARRVLLDQALDHVGDLLAGGVAHVAALEHLVAVAVDDLALLVQHVVVLERRACG